MKILKLEQRGVVWTETQWDRFVERWVAFRQSRQLTQQELASRLGITVKRVRRIEKKREVPDGEVVRRFGRLERSQLERGGVI